MKTSIRFVVFLLLAVAPLMAREYKLVPSQHVPSATGWAEVDRDENGNTTVALEVRHLAQPNRLNPPRQTYVVWVKARNTDDIEKAGMLRVKEDLKGSIRFLTLYPSFELFITAEDDVNATIPVGQEVLRTIVDQ